MARHIKKGDMVEVIAGAQKGTTGKIMRVITSKDRVISNVLPLNPKTSKGTRVRFTTDSKGVKKRVAVDGSEIGILRKA